MKPSRSPLQLIFAITIILIVGIIPHHHHHGDFCWATITHTEHHQKAHSDTPHECPTEPCDNSNCQFESIRSFLQVEQNKKFDLLSHLGNILQPTHLSIPFVYVNNKRFIKKLSYTSSSFIGIKVVRGPPMML